MSIQNSQSRQMCEDRKPQAEAASGCKAGGGGKGWRQGVEVRGVWGAGRGESECLKQDGFLGRWTCSETLAGIHNIGNTNATELLALKMTNSKLYEFHHN